MLEELKSIDSSVIEELMEIKRERETIAERLAKMEAEKEQVSDVVYRRVKRDYQSKSTGLERKAAPLKDRAKAEYVKLKSLIDRLESQHQSTRLDREEVDFRNRLGEFEKKQFEARVEELDRTLSEQEADLAEAAEVRDRFVEAFDSEEELASGAPTPAPPEPEPEAEEPAADEAKGAAPAPATPAELDAGITAPQPVGEPPAPPSADQPPPADGTVILPPEGAAPPPPPPPPPPPTNAQATAEVPEAKGGAAPAEGAGGRTMVLTSARLVAVDDDLGAPEFPLQPLTFVGRTPDNQVRLNKPAVSRRHAQLTLGDKGWLIKDLQSENGSYVNGEKITERILADGDRVQIGTVRLVFRAN